MLKYFYFNFANFKTLSPRTHFLLKLSVNYISEAFSTILSEALTGRLADPKLVVKAELV